MILNFSVENYKIFKEKTTLTMVATYDKTHMGNTIPCEANKNGVLKTASIYGANASGKTKFIEALHLMSNFVRGSFSHLPGTILNHTPFIYDAKMVNKPTSLEIEFITDDKRYAYGFSYDSKRITDEHLYLFTSTRKSIIFERHGQKYTFSPTDRKMQEGNAIRVRDNVLYISVAAQFNHGPSLDVVRWFSEKLIVISGNIPDFSIDNLISVMDRNREFGILVKKALRIADFGITRIYDRNASLKKKDVVSGAAVSVIPHISDIWVEHTIGNRKVELQLASESSGTLRFLAVIGPVIDALLFGKTVVVDELDLSFHTDICEWILSLFLSPYENKKGSQLIFNTHDVGLLDQGLIRRDQIWFTSKDWDTYEASMTRLSDYGGVRKDLDIRRAYLNGSFGAKPFIAPDRLME
jgi:AAA15 family ATPase/GTPase